MKLSTIFKLFKPAVLKEELQDQKLIAKKYKYWRIRIFYSMYIGYVFFYFTRKSFTFIIPQLVSDLGYSYSDLGLLSTILYLSYGASKFVSGILSDRANPRYFMAIGLMLTGVFNILFGFSSSLIFLGITWGLNGWFQGWGWPPITKQLTYWYSKEERGMWWSLCSTSHNVGGAAIPLIAGYYAQNLGWRYAMFIPGGMCIIVGLLLINRLRDVPRSLGLPPIEKYRASENDSQDKSDSDNEEIDTYELPSDSPATSLSAKQILKEHVLSNNLVLIMAVSCFFVYVVKTAINDWTVPFLVGNRGYDLITAGSSIVWFEVGGLFGMLFAGWVTDRLFVGKRAPCIMISAICLALSLWLLWQFNWNNHVLDFTLIGLIGFFVFAPQMLIGLAAAEYVDKKAACSANGFVSWWGYVGAAAAGYPLGLLIDYSWDWYFIILLTCSLLSCLALLPAVLTTTRYVLSTQNS
jgi:OPA family sugar phosphate sensor protein UhpC-like MFS transporter